jgi:hypothetical protein
VTGEVSAEAFSWPAAFKVTTYINNTVMPYGGDGNMADEMAYGHNVTMIMWHGETEEYRAVT